MRTLPKLSDIRETAADREGSILARDREFVAMKSALDEVLALAATLVPLGAPSPQLSGWSVQRAIRDVIRTHIDLEG